MLGFLDKLSHDVLKRWQTRWFVLDARTKTIRYYTDKAKTDLKGEYKIQSISEDDAVSPDRLFSFVITGISSSLNNKKSDTASKSTLHISASTALLKDYWSAAILKTIDGGTRFDTNMQDKIKRLKNGKLM